MVWARNSRSAGNSAKCDVLVAGAGPAGLSIAGACARQGLHTVLVAPGLGSPWGQSYGAFTVELTGLDLEAAILRTFRSPLVSVRQDSEISLRPSYSRFSTEALQSLLLQRATSAGVDLRDGVIREVGFDSHSGRAVCSGLLESGPGEVFEAGGRQASLAARVVINATGGQAQFDGEVPRAPTGYQTAYGQWIQVEQHGFAEGEMCLMDYSPLAGVSTPTFLYAMPESGHAFGPGVLFVQETSLISTSPIPGHLLREALTERLKKRGIVPRQVLGTERCVIPMGGGLPPHSSLTLPYGASAGFIHPATGYQIAKAFKLADPLARLIKSELHHGLHSTVAAALELMWPCERRRAWRLYEMAAQVLSNLSPREMAGFIESFFNLPSGRWERFMEGSMSSPEIAESMWRTFATAPFSLRTDLARGASVVVAKTISQSFTPARQQSLAQ